MTSKMVLCSLLQHRASIELSNEKKYGERDSVLERAMIRKIAQVLKTSNTNDPTECNNLESNLTKP